MQTAITAMTAVATTKSENTRAEPLTMQKRIGSIVYEVEIHFNPDAKETLNDKKIKLIKRDLEAAS
jgi:hypothetical protein